MLLKCVCVIIYAMLEGMQLAAQAQAQGSKGRLLYSCPTYGLIRCIWLAKAGYRMRDQMDLGCDPAGLFLCSFPEPVYLAIDSFEINGTSKHEFRIRVPSHFSEAD